MITKKQKLFTKKINLECMDNSINCFNNEISQDGCKQLLVLLIDIKEFPEVNSSHFVRRQ